MKERCMQKILGMLALAVLAAGMMAEPAVAAGETNGIRLEEYGGSAREEEPDLSAFEKEETVLAKEADISEETAFAEGAGAPEKPFFAEEQIFTEEAGSLEGEPGDGIFSENKVPGDGEMEPVLPEGENEIDLFGSGEAGLLAEDSVYKDGSFEYELYTDENGNTKALITSYTGRELVLTVPSKVGGYPVGAIGEMAFDSQEGIMLPEGVTKIEAYAFSNCGGLMNIALPSSLKEVGENAFDCMDLEYVYYAGTENDWNSIAIKSGNDCLTGCSRCYESTGWFTYEVPGTNIRLLCADGANIKIVGCNENASGELSIPEEIDGKTVAEIEKQAFYGSNLTGIEIPKQVKAIGSRAFYECCSLKKVNIPSGVVEIGEYTFYGCDSLREIMLPEGVTKIGAYAFDDCECLEKVNVPSGVTEIEEYTFNWCGALKEITLPEGVTKIGECAFCYCLDLESIALPSSLVEVGKEAFDSVELKYVYYAGTENDWTSIAINESGNDGLIHSDNPPECVRCYESTGRFTYEVPGTNVRLECADGANVKIIGCNTDAEGCLTIPEQINGKLVTEIADMAFYECGELISIEIPKQVTAMGSYAFYDCVNLEKVNVPSGVTKIEEYTFYGCEVLLEITLPKGVTKIGAYAFYGCFCLKKVNVPSGVTEIEEHTFNYCGALKEITLPEGITKIGAYAFCVCFNLEKINIPSGITEIKENTFDSCGALKEITLPEGVTRIGAHAFYYCSDLKKANVPSGVMEVEDAVFEGCHLLERITLPEGVTRIGVNAFSGCSGLKSIVLPLSLKEVRRGAFGEASGLTYVYYAGTKEDWNSIVISELENDCLINSDAPPARIRYYGVTRPVGCEVGDHTWGAYKVVKKATALSAGSRTRTCTLCGKEETVKIAKLKATLKLTVTKLPLQVKKSVNLKKLVTGLAAGDSIKSWKTSDKNIAAVTPAGKVTGKKEGTAKITVILASRKKGEISVTVQKAAVTTAKIGNVPKTLTLPKGGKYSLKPAITPITSQQKVTYQTSNKKAVTVDSKGVLTAKAVGKAKITVTSGKKKTVVTVSVKNPKDIIKNIPASLTLKKGKTYVLQPKLSGISGKAVYTSSKPAVASVASSGKISAKKAGKTVITVKVGSVSVKCTVTVK